MSVDGVPRIVCGVTEKTTCKEVVIALAQSLGRPGRYTLKEKFKEFERSVTPSERLLESLDKYGQQAREVQLTLLHNGPSLWEGAARTRRGRYQAGPAQLRRADAGGRVRRDSGALSLHRQSLPPLSRLRQQAEQPPEDSKRPKRKSLTLMEEAWGWLENLGRGQQSGRDRGNNKEAGTRSESSLDVSVTVATEASAPGGKQGKMKGGKSGRPSEDQRTSCCLGNQGRDKQKSTTSISETKSAEKDGRHSSGPAEAGTESAKAEDLMNPSSARKIADDKRRLRNLIAKQQTSLQGLQVQITSTDRQIHELEGQLRARQTQQDAQQNVIEEEEEQLQFWENELKAEEGYEKDLQVQFLEMKEKAAECKCRLELYKNKMYGHDLSRVQRAKPEEVKETAGLVTYPAEDLTVPNMEFNQRRSNTACEVNTDREFPPRGDCNLQSALISPNQIKEHRASGQNHHRELWGCSSGSQSLKTETVVHRSEITIHLGSTRV